MVNLVQHPLDPCLFVAHEAGERMGLVSAHVDDFLVAGDPFGFEVRLI